MLNPTRKTVIALSVSFTRSTVYAGEKPAGTVEVEALTFTVSTISAMLRVTVCMEMEKATAQPVTVLAFFTLRENH